MPADSGAALRQLARAVELQQAGRLEEAEAVYAELLAADDRDPTALINAGVLSISRNEVATAIDRLARAVALVPGNAIAHANLGFALIRAGRDEEALRTLEQAVALKPEYAQAHNSRGIALARLGRRDEAKRAFDHALALLPAYAEAAINLGEVANRDGDTRTARAAYGRVPVDDARHALALSGIALADALDGELDAAIAALERVVAEAPSLASAWQTLGAVCNWAWRHEAAERAFRRALALDPSDREASFGIASTLFARGDYAGGWAAFEASRAGLEPAQAHLRALRPWDGSALDGTLVVHGEQGLGDVVQFARFVPALRPRVQRLVLLLDGYWAPLAPLLATLAGVDRVVVDAGAFANENPRARVSFLSLPYLAGAQPAALAGAPYLSAPADRVAGWRERLANAAAPRVGVAWSVHARDDHGYVTAHKSIPARSLAPLLAVAGVSFVSIQPGADGDPASLEALAPRVAATGRAIRDFGDTAALISELDLVVSADTAVAHVAGALGKPVWLLDRFNCCWRWRLAPETSPWYPSMTLFRQSRFGDWGDAVARAAAALVAWRDARLTNTA